MEASDVMTTNVITIGPDTEVKEIIKTLLDNHLNGVPVVDAEQRVIGVVTEGDLVRRVDEAGRRSWWRRTVHSGADLAGDYVKSHGRTALEVMTPKPFTVAEDTPLEAVGKLIREHNIKVVPVVRGGTLVGIVTRTDVLRAVSAQARESVVAGDDKAIRESILKEIESVLGDQFSPINVVVSDGVVELWGLVESQKEKNAAEVAAENTPGVRRVENHLGVAPRGVAGYGSTL